MEYRLSEDEIACVKELAELFENNAEWINYSSASREASGPTYDLLELPAGRREAILAMMQQIGAITQVQHSSEGRFIHFRITPKAVQIAREIGQQESAKRKRRDNVEEVKTTIRSNRAMAWSLIAFFTFTAFVTLLNQLLQLLKTLGWLKGG